VLNAIDEQDFLPCSDGFRPGLSAHDALDAIDRTIFRGPIAYGLEADIQSYFDAMVRSQLMAFVERRIGDSSLLRLIQKWIHVGVIEDGRLLVTETGTGQGQVISPLLTFDFLGFTHICARDRRGRFTIHVRTLRKRLRRSVKAVAQWCQQHRHDPVENQAATLNAKLRGHYQYYGRPTNYRSLARFYRLVRRIWHKWLNRRTRGNRLPWRDFAQLLARHPLLRPRLCHARVSAGSPG
jgi:retron-type reverse transcriptase